MGPPNPSVPSRTKYPRNSPSVQGTVCGVVIVRTGAAPVHIGPPLLAFLRVERRLQTFRERLRGTNAPIVQEHDTRCLAGHMLVDRNDVDARTAQGLQYGL